jgi:hypothetical protein
MTEGEREREREREREKERERERERQRKRERGRFKAIHCLIRLSWGEKWPVDFGDVLPVNFET